MRLNPQLGPGDHAALFYRSRAEQFAVVIPYIKEGLARNERCLYIADDNSVRLVTNALEGAGVDVAEAQNRNALTVSTKHETYLRAGIFEPEQMIADLKAEVQNSLAAGFTAFRATGEMTWALTLPSALARLIEYEAGLDADFPNGFIGLCQYNETSFRPELISEVLRTHPKIIARGRLFKNPCYDPGTQRLNSRLFRLEDLLQGPAAAQSVPFAGVEEPIPASASRVER